MRKKWYQQRKPIDLWMDKLSNLLILMLVIQNSEYSCEKCHRLRKYAHVLEELSLRNPRMQKKRRTR